MATISDWVQMHIRVERALKRRFYSWCVGRGKSMSEVCRLVLLAVLDERIDLDELTDEADLRDTQDDVRYGGTW